ncbi:hypothetical protein M436DRAFT_46142 [Aureobasidium namibiae CBS 147.97]|uniref:RED-like N-terminal domain-containing protein n=1 Tax=Aureobasidium namibiae CBS 147.97 TaxID=1043004 RepID=A0A074WJH3_9PEZI|nr:uncharacterized protein M436DRAFT_46142 [Aureobasidium namibiae CBS 147.97]KEQ73285.1 hypothetical protein M436DRAFT_46142 [Aureobasidium namibiae CBS 147.97]
MNNDQFRKLLNTPARQEGASNSPRPSAVPSSLGSKRSSFMPMTPRSVRGVSGNDFARQVAERNAANQTTKKFKGSAAPKGSRLGSGFTDRTQNRYDDEADDRAARIKALEEQVKLGQLDNATFEALRDQITGGDVDATHLVKGLDRKLLERVRKGENVLGGAKPAEEEDLEDEFERFEEKEVARVEREKIAKKGQMAPPPPVAGAKRSRNQILAELKAQRKAQADARLAARPELGDRFRDVGSSRASSRVEVDAKGREVLITTDEHGNVKKKVRKVQVPIEEPTVSAQTHKLLDEGVTMPPPKPIEKPVEAPKDDSDDDIFDGVGDAYDPLGGLGDDDSSDDEDGESTASRNYFKSTTTTTDETSEPQAPQNPFNDAAFLAAIKKAGALSNISLSLNASSDDPSAPESAEAKEARLQKRAQMLAASDRDLEDMDLGFGSSRFGDEEEGDDGKRIKLSTWKGNGDDDDDDGDDGGSKEKKKKGRRRKGDKNSAADVLGVMEKRKEAGK